MKRGFTLVLLLLLTVGCTSNRKFFESGNAIVTERVEEIKINMVNNMPLCNVQINGRQYVFLIDTGAPSIISKAIFNDLNLQESHSIRVVDSQKKKQREIFAILPELQIGNLVFQDIGCGVINIEGDLKCFGIDGIIGANLLAKSFFEFDYKNSRINVSNKLAPFQVDKSDFTFNFSPKVQKSPVVKGKVFDKKLSFTFDTGSNGYIKIPNDYDYYQTKSSGKNFITMNGVNGIGVYGANAHATTFVMKNNVALDNISFQNEIIDSGHSTLIGNKFLKDFVFVIDWQQNKIYFKRNESPKEKDVNGFGFTYLFTTGKALISSKIENRDIPLNLGDEIVAIDDVIFAEINSLDICKYYLNKVEKDKAEINIKVKRNNEILSFHLAHQQFIE